jgi:hypothetical protein
MCGTINGMTKALARAIVAAFVLCPIPVLAYTAPAIAEQMRIDKPNNAPRGDGCVPVGVSKSPNGIVYAIEECHGEKYKTRMN